MSIFTVLRKSAQLLILLLLLLPLLAKAQVQELGIPFQGVAKDYSGQFVNERTIYIELSIFSKENPARVLFSELHQTKTDEWGIFSVLIGKGQALSAVYTGLSQMDWSFGNYQLHIKMAIVPEAPLGNWAYQQHLISLGTAPFGIVPYALYSIKSGNSSENLSNKLSISDTSQMLVSYVKKSETVDKASLDSLMRLKITIKDSGLYYITPTQLTTTMNSEMNKKLNKSDSIQFYVTPTQLNAKTFDTIFLSNRIEARLKLEDTLYLSNRIEMKELIENKSTNMNALADYSDQKYPSVKAIKDYVDNQISMGAPDATINNRGILQLTGDLTGISTEPRIASNAITTSKVLDAAITDAKIATGIQASKVGLGNLSNHAQLYNLNGLTTQIQDFVTPGSAGLSPNWSSVGSSHTLNLPMASANSVTAGMISKSDYDRFNTAANLNINNLTTNGNAGVAVVTGQSLNIPNYTIGGLSGLVNPNFILAGPSSGVAGAVQYRALVADDIPNNSANTSGNATTASQLQTARLINAVAFDGSQDIVIKATTTNKLIFSAAGMGANDTEYFDGNTNKIISYNSVGAAPKFGSTDIATLGTITAGTWSGDVIGASYGGAGTINGIMKANGTGVVSAASSVTDFQAPLAFATPLSNTSNTISINQANTNTDGYLGSTDWNSFNNKISATEKAAANGVATLNALGKIPTSQIAAISFSSGYVVSSQSAMLALSTAVVGSIAIRTDNSKNYVLSASDPGVLNNWLELLMPAAVSSVNGYTTGSITLTSSDIAEGTNLYFNNARVRAAVDAFLAGNTPISYNASTGKIGITQSSTNTSGYLSTTDWNTFNNKQNTFASQSANSFYAGPNGLSGTPSFRTILAADIPLLNQNTTGNAATSTSLLNARSINGVSFNGTADITIPASTTNTITFNSSGTGAASSANFNGSSALVISYNSIGALPTVGATSITTLGTIGSGTWSANVIGSSYGGAGAVNGILKANGSGLVAAAIAGTDYESPLTFSSPIARSTNTISIPVATTNANGYLSSTDWNIFNSKQATITAGTGVTIQMGNTIQIGQEVSTTSSPIFAAVTSNSDVTAKRYKLTMPSATDASTTSTSLDLSTGNVFTINLKTATTSVVFTNAAIGTYLIKLHQDATGGREATFTSNANLKWAGGIAPTMTDAGGKLDIVTLIYDGTNYYATIVKNF